MLTLQILFPIAVLLKFWLDGKALSLGQSFGWKSPNMPRNLQWLYRT